MKAVWAENMSEAQVLGLSIDLQVFTVNNVSCVMKCCQQMVSDMVLLVTLRILAGQHCPCQSMQTCSMSGALTELPQ